MSGVAAIVTRFVDAVWNAEDERAAYDLVAPDYVGMSGQAGPEGALAWHRDRRRSFPDLRFSVVDLLVDGERAAVRWQATGTQRGEFGPVPPTGRAVSYSGATFLRVADGRIAEVWSVNELFGVLEQLGVTFTPPEVHA